MRAGRGAARSAAGAGCKRDAALGAPDSFLLVAPVPPRDGAGASRARRAFRSSPTVALDDPHAVPLHQQFAVGFAGEVLRTDYLAKQLVREIDVGGRRYADGQRASAREPTVLIMGGARAGGPTSRGVALKGSFGGEDEHADVLAGRGRRLSGPRPRAAADAGRGARVCWPRRASRPATPLNPTQPLVDRLRARARGHRARVAGRGGARGDAAGRRGHQPRSATLFAAVRENRYALGADGAPRPAARAARGPGRGGDGALSPGPVEDGRPEDRARRGLRAVRQGSRSRRGSARRPCSARSATSRRSCCRPGRAPSWRASRPRDIADLVEAYGRALPAERVGDHRGSSSSRPSARP